MTLLLRRFLTLALLLFFAAECIAVSSVELPNEGDGTCVGIPHENVHLLDVLAEGSEVRDNKDDSKATYTLEEVYGWVNCETIQVCVTTVRYRIGSSARSLTQPRHERLRIFQI